jgi:hypothetical protein
MPGSLPGCDQTCGVRTPCRRGWLLASLLLCCVSVTAQTSSPHSPHVQGCGCPDGRRFQAGASLFGKNSARVVVTGFRPQLPAGVLAGELTQCTDLLVLGQVIRLFNTPDGRPFLKRESIRRGTIHNICDTKIHFVEAKKSYDFFADDGGALTLTGNEPGPAPMPDDSAPEESSEVELNENLTGKDLLQLIPQKGSGESPDDPDRAVFDAEDLKEGAYLICTRGSKALLADNAGTRNSGSQEVNVAAGTFGRIEKRAGFRSDPRWIVEVLPDSAPQPFWRSLMSIPRMYAGPREPTLPRKVILASSRVMEINHVLDRSRVEWTRFGDVSEQTGNREQAFTERLAEIYAPRELPLEENVAAAQTSQIFAAIRKTTIGVRLVPKDPEIFSRLGTLVLEERTSDGQGPNAVPDLLRRQCFLGRYETGHSQDLGAKRSTRELSVSGADVKVFRPKDYSQVPPSYYAIDLELQLQPNFSAKEMPLVCRFPSASIDLALLDMAERILSSQFEIRRTRTGAWPSY